MRSLIGSLTGKGGSPQTGQLGVQLLLSCVLLLLMCRFSCFFQFLQDEIYLLFKAVLGAERKFSGPVVVAQEIIAIGYPTWEAVQ